MWEGHVVRGIGRKGPGRILELGVVQAGQGSLGWGTRWGTQVRSIMLGRKFKWAGQGESLG